MQRKRKDDRQAWSHRVYQYKATLQEQSSPAQWPEALRAVVCAQRALWNACQAAWERNRTQYEALMAQGDTLRPLREARDQALAQVTEASAFPQKYLCNETSHGMLGLGRHLYYRPPLDR
jgi:hypothetical protein